MAFNFLKSLDADDIFISYSREDGSAYLTGLDAALSKSGFSCFTDRRGTDAGRLPPKTLFRKIRNCKTLVLLATPGALKEPENIAPEVSGFAEVNGTSRIICVSFDRDAEFANWSNTPWYIHVEGKAREREDPKTLKTGEPSSAVVEAIVAASDYMKSKDRLRRYRNRALGVLAVLVVAIIAAAIIAGVMFKRAGTETARATAATAKAQQATLEADKATREAEKALSQATVAQIQAGLAQLIAEIAKADATQQKRLANEAASKARTAENLAATQQARANHEQAIAEARSLANRSQRLLRQRPEQVQNSLKVAVDSMKKSSAMGVHTVEADTALRESLALFPRQRTSYKYVEGEALGDITSVALSPDGRFFASVSKEKLSIYEVGSRNPPKVLDCNCRELALSGAKLAAVITTEGSLEILDLRTGQRRALSAAGDADHIALSPGGRYLAIASRLGESEGQHSKVSILEVSSGRMIKAFDDYVDSPGEEASAQGREEAQTASAKKSNSDPRENLNMVINDIAFGPTGNLAVGGKYNSPQGGRFAGRVVVWALRLDAEGINERELTDADFAEMEVIQQQSEVISVTPGLDMTHFATDTGVWKRLSGRIDFESVGRLPFPLVAPFTSLIGKIAFGSDGNTVTVVRTIQGDQHAKDNDRGLLETWDSKGHWDSANAFQTEAVNRLGFKRDGQFVAAILDQLPNENPARIFSANDAKEAAGPSFDPESKERDVKNASPSADFIINADNKSVVIWDVWGGKKMTVTLDDTLKKVEQATISTGGGFFALSGNDKKGAKSVVIYRSKGDSYENWKVIPQDDVREAEDDKDQDADVVEMSLSADGLRLAVLYTYSETFVRVWDVTNRQDFSPICLKGGTKAQSQSCQMMSDASHVMISPDGRYLVMTSSERSALMDLSKGPTAELKTLLDDTLIMSMAFSVDGRYLGLGSDEGVLHIFEAARPDDEIALLQHTGTVTAVAFSDDGKYVATASRDRHPYRLNEEESYPIRIWLLRPKDLIEEATERLEVLNRASR